MLSVDALRNVLLCLAHRRLDFLLVSHGFSEPPRAEIVSPANSLILSQAAYRGMREAGRLPAAARGQLARLLPAPGAVQVTELGGLGLGEIRAEGAELRVEGPGAWTAIEPRRPDAPLFHAVAGRRRTVLVLPVMLAVGGAERNLIEVMKRMRGRHSFVVVTTERVMAERGSLNHQVAPHCDALFEIGELAPQAEFMALIDSIARSFRPELVFICNGSPWLLSHTRALRERFADVPIVDQQVYDEREGWIESYDDPGIQSFDRFVAINRRIETAFRERIGIHPERIDLIHHAIDDTRFNLEAADRCDRAATAARLGLPAGRRIFAQVGRLTAQKRPLDFLDLARRARAAGLDDCFLLVGSGELATACDEYRAKHGLANVTRIPFWEDMSRLYPLLDGLVLTSEYEGLPVVLLEALAMGVPVLATDVGDIRLLVEEHGAGRLAERIGDGPALFRSFGAWRASLDALRVRARESAPLVASRFSGSAAAAAYERCFEKACSAYAKVRRVSKGEAGPCRTRLA
jgi:glycosyltransferase involved in cell wall biosynthesis